jgi:hypothetical protein
MYSDEKPSAPSAKRSQNSIFTGHKNVRALWSKIPSLSEDIAFIKWKDCKKWAIALLRLSQ